MHKIFLASVLTIYYLCAAQNNALLTREHASLDHVVQASEFYSIVDYDSMHDYPYNIQDLLSHPIYQISEYERRTNGNLKRHYLPCHTDHAQPACEARTPPPASFCDSPLPTRYQNNSNNKKRLLKTPISQQGNIQEPDRKQNKETYLSFVPSFTNIKANQKVRAGSMGSFTMILVGLPITKPRIVTEQSVTITTSHNSAFRKLSPYLPQNFCYPPPKHTSSLMNLNDVGE